MEGNEEIEIINEEENKVVEENLSTEIANENNFIKRFLSATMDQIITLALALVLLLLFDGILRLTGFYVAERQPIFLVVYIITNILYTSICESTKLKKTIGKKIVLK